MRGKIKIGMSAFLLSMLVASFFATFEFAVPTVSATSTPELSTSTIVNPLLKPGDTVVFDVLTNNVENLWSVEFTLNFDTDLLTPTGYFFASGGETEFANVFVEDLNDAGGYVHLGASRPLFGGKGVDYLGTGDGVTTSYPLSVGVIEPGSEQAFYKVTNEFIGTAQTWLNPNTGLIEKRDPGPWRGGGGDGIVDRMPIIPSPYPGVEMVYVGGVPYLSYADPTDPRWITDYVTGEPRSSQVYDYRSRWPATGKVITMDYATTDTVPAIASMDYAPSGGTGSVTFATAPAVGEEVYMQYRYRTGLTTDFVLLVASIMFTVEGRGACDMHFDSSTMLDQYIPANEITHDAIDGLFDNRLQATMSVPHVVNTTVTTEGDYFDIFVYIGPWMDKNVEKMWGFQFILNYDPTIITAVDYETLGIFNPGPSEIGADYAAVSGYSYYGDPDGLSTSETVPIARIGFVVLEKGVTLLELHDTATVDVTGHTMVHEVVNGSFANTENIWVSLDALFLQKRRWSVSRDGELFNMTAQMTNRGDGVTKTRAIFRVFEKHGELVATLTTPDVYIEPSEYHHWWFWWWGTPLRLTEQLNVASLDKPASYAVELHIEYMNCQGEWVTGYTRWSWWPHWPWEHWFWRRTTIVQTFTLYP